MPKKKKNHFRVADFFERFRRLFSLNIGTIIFGILFLYMIFSAFLYLTSAHIESYQVTVGPLSSNETYTGLALREETIVKADSNGYLTYYAREGDKINANGVVYGISSTQTPEVQTKLTPENLSKIRIDMMNFSKGFNPSKFNKTYSFKYELEGNILQYAGVTADFETEPVSGTDENGNPISGGVYNNQAETVTLGNQTLSKAFTDGVVLYARDEYEDITLENITLDDFDQNSYHETDLKTLERVKANQDIYKLVTDERWNLIIPLSEKQAVKLADRSSVRVKFLKDEMTQSGDFEIIEIEGKKFGKLGFNKGLVRYASDRFLEIELVTNTISGLKIPLSSIVTKEFYTIPEKYLIKEEESQQTGFKISTKSKDGQKATVFVSPTIYAEVEEVVKGATMDSDAVKETFYYVDKSAFKEGDGLVTSDEKSKYIVGETAVLEGVYCINQGYAVFRRISILDQNEEYAIVSKNTKFGLVRYDHIVRNADEVKEQDILY